MLKELLFSTLNDTFEQLYKEFDCSDKANIDINIKSNEEFVKFIDELGKIRRDAKDTFVEDAVNTLCDNIYMLAKKSYEANKERDDSDRLKMIEANRKKQYEIRLNMLSDKGFTNECKDNMHQLVDTYANEIMMPNMTYKFGKVDNETISNAKDVLYQFLCWTMRR